MIAAVKRVVVGLAILGASLIALFWALGMIARHAPAPISTIAQRAESAMQPH